MANKTLSQTYVNRPQSGPFYNKNNINSANWVDPNEDDDKEQYRNPILQKIDDASDRFVDVKEGAVDAMGAIKIGQNAANLAKGGTVGALGGLTGAAGVVMGANSFRNQWNSLDGAAGKLAFSGKRGALEGGLAAAGMAAGGMAVGAALGATMGSVVPVVGTIIGAGIGALTGGFMKKLKTGKGRDQLRRDLIREQMVKAGFLDKEGRYTLADGTTFEMGKDGGFKYADGFHAYEVDHSNKLQGTVFGHALPLAELIAGSDDRLTSDFAGYLTRMALSNTDDLNQALGNLKDAAVKAGADPEKLMKYVLQKKADGVISDDEAAAYVNGIGNLFSDHRNLTLIGEDPKTQAKTVSSNSDSSHSIASRVVRQSPAERRRRVQKAVAEVVPKPVIPSYEEERKKAADMWGHDYDAAVNQRIDFKKAAGWIT